MCIRDSLEPADVVGMMDNSHLIGLIILGLVFIHTVFHIRSHSFSLQKKQSPPGICFRLFLCLA